MLSLVDLLSKMCVVIEKMKQSPILEIIKAHCNTVLLDSLGKTSVYRHVLMSFILQSDTLGVNELLQL